jgi:alpha-L-rhamnosidase
MNRYNRQGVRMPSVAAPVDVRFEHRTDEGSVLGIGTGTPRLSWVVPEADPSFAQEAYEVEVTRGGATEVFRVASAEQVLVPWPAAPLAARETAAVRVRVAGTGATSPWSDPATVEAGLLDPGDWTARFVSPVAMGGLDAPAPVLGATLDVPAGVTRARLYASAHGVYSATLNGRAVSDEVLAPGWTAYADRLRYQTYDVTDLIRPGANELEVLLGNGWYRGRLGFTGARAFYGDRLALLAQLEVTTADGAVHVLATHGSWTARESGILADDLYDGQRTDLRLAGGARPERAGPDGAGSQRPRPAGAGPGGSQDGAPAAGRVETVDADLSRLVAPDGPPVRVTGTLPAVEVLRSPSGATLVDFGQNLVGWVRLRVRGLEPGSEVTVRHAEVLEHGELGVRPLRSAKATDTYFVAGGEGEVLEPNLTFHGFRYAEISGVPAVSAADVDAVVIGTDLRRSGWFECSSDLLNQFHENVVWSARGNFLDVPTDCPQRDERLGWTGDMQVFAPTAAFLFDIAGFLTSWLADLAAEQKPDGSVPYVVPDVIETAAPAAAGWGDAAALVPWVLHERTGDAQLLERQLPSMRAWVDKIAALAGPDRVWSGGFQFGDWLDPTAPPDQPAKAQAHPDVVATAHLARSAEVVAQAARLLGRLDVAAAYERLASEVRGAFAHEYVTPAGRVVSDAATAYALAIAWSLLPTREQRDRAGEHLADLVREAGFRIGTGFLGTPPIADALTQAGHVDIAYRLILQTQCPSWLYPVTMGATTVWERWDSMLPDGTINPGQMTSFNHYALGAVADWLHRTGAGLAPAAPGYRRLLVRPLPTPQLTRVSARHRTPYGDAEVSWERADGELVLRVLVPVGATAVVHVPGDEQPLEVGHGRHEWRRPDDRNGAGGVRATIRDVMDDEPAWRAVVDAAKELAVVAGEPEAAQRLGAFLDAPAGALVDALAPRGLVDNRSALRERLAPLRLEG